MKTEKMKAAEKARMESAEKWANYKGALTPEVIKELHEDNERIKKLCEEATREWLEMQKGRT